MSSSSDPLVMSLMMLTSRFCECRGAITVSRAGISRRGKAAHLSDTVCSIFSLLVVVRAAEGRKESASNAKGKGRLFALVILIVEAEG